MSSHEDPEWLTQALGIAPTERSVQVEGAAVHYLDWGPPDAPSVVLVHGGLAHAHWWDHVAPHLTGHRVIAPDLTGHGDSGTRDGYDMRQWGREVLAVIRAAGVHRPVVVGHSMGGYPVVSAAVEAQAEIRGVVTLDSRFNDQEYGRTYKKSRTFASVEEAVASFDPMHARSSIAAPDGLLRHVATTSVRREADRWRWKRDDDYRISQVPLRKLLPELETPLALVQTEHGLVTDEIADEMRGLTPAPSIAVKIPGAGHNPMLEQPIALIGVLRTLLVTQWKVAP